jgi:hypothetical protein
VEQKNKADDICVDDGDVTGIKSGMEAAEAVVSLSGVATTITDALVNCLKKSKAKKPSPYKREKSASKAKKPAPRLAFWRQERLKWWKVPPHIVQPSHNHQHAFLNVGVPVVSTASNYGNIIVLGSSLFVIHATYKNKQSDSGNYSAFLCAVAYCSAEICGIISVSTTWLLKSLVTTLIGDFFWDDLSWHHRAEVFLGREAEIRNQSQEKLWDNQSELGRMQLWCWYPYLQAMSFVPWL